MVTEKNEHYFGGKMCISVTKEEIKELKQLKRLNRCLILYQRQTHGNAPRVSRLLVLGVFSSLVSMPHLEQCYSYHIKPWSSSIKCGNCLEIQGKLDNFKYQGHNNKIGHRTTQT